MEVMFKRNILLLGKRSSNLACTYRFIFEMIPADEDLSQHQFSKVGEIYLPEESKEDFDIRRIVANYVQPQDAFNALLFVIDEADFISNSFLQWMGEFRQEMSELFGIVITKCSEQSNATVIDLLKANPNKREIQNFAKLGIHIVSDKGCVSRSDIIKTIKPLGLCHLPAELFPASCTPGTAHATRSPSPMDTTTANAHVCSILVIGKTESRRSLVWKKIWGVSGKNTDLSANIDGVEYTFETIDLHDWQRETSDTKEYRLSISEKIGPKMINAILFVIDEDDLDCSGLPLSKWKFGSKVIPALGIIVTVKATEISEKHNSLRQKAITSASGITGLGVHLLSEKNFDVSCNSFITEIQQLTSPFSTSELFQFDDAAVVDSYFIRTVLLFSSNTQSDNAMVKMAVWKEDKPQITIDRIIYNFNDVTLPKEWQSTSTWFFEKHREKIKQYIVPFNALLFVIDKKDLIRYGLPLYKWKFRSEIVTSALGIIITECSDSEDKDTLINKIDFGWSKTTVSELKFGVSFIPNGIDPTSLQNGISKQGLMLLPSELFQ